MTAQDAVEQPAQELGQELAALVHMHADATAPPRRPAAPRSHGCVPGPVVHSLAAHHPGTRPGTAVCDHPAEPPTTAEPWRPVPATFAADLELLEATALRHASTLAPRTSVHLSAAVDALTDPLVPPHLAGVAAGDTTDLHGVVQGVRDRLQRLARHDPDPQQTLAVATAVRELTDALHTLSPASGSTTADR